MTREVIRLAPPANTAERCHASIWLAGFFFSERFRLAFFLAASIASTVLVAFIGKETKGLLLAFFGATLNIRDKIERRKTHHLRLT